MVRKTALLFLSIVVLAAGSSAQSSDKDPRISRALAVQTAMTEARQHLQAGRPGDAVAVLEAEILYVNGNVSYLDLMKDAYLANLRELTRANADANRIEHTRRQLRILDPKLNLDEPAKPTVRAVPDETDPFQQTPLDRAAPGEVRARATAAFAQKRYGEAAALFAQAHVARTELTAEERQAWSYCRLHTIVTRLNKGGEAGTALAAMEKEADEASRLGGPPLEKFAREVLAAIRQRKGNADSEVTAVPEGWQAHEAGSFRVFYRESRQRAVDVAKAAEQLRTVTFEKWSGPAGSAWSPRCDVWLHASAADYAKSTEKPATSPGHSSVGLKDGRVVARRIDLRCDDSALTDVTLPREVAYVVVTDLFADQPLPRWADVGMTTLAGPAEDAARYRRALPRLAQERKLFTIRELLKTAEFPEPEKITAFYVESVSLVDYLVRLKGAKAFALYLREAPRRGYEEALQRHYGIKDANELQEKWLKFAAAGE